MKIKTALRFHLILVRMVKIKKQMTTNVGKSVPKREYFIKAGESTNWYSHYGNQHKGSSKTKNTT